MAANDAVAEQPKKRAGRRPGRWVLLCAVGFVVLFVALDIDWGGPAPAPPTVLVEYDGHTWEVTPLEHLRARGLKIEDVPPEENAALDYAIAVSLLLRPDHETDRQRTYVMQYRWSDDCNLLWSYLQAARPALERAEIGLTKDGYLEPLKMTSGNLWDVPLPHLAPSRELSRAFVARGKLAEAGGRHEDALDDYLASVRMGNHVARGPFVIEGLVGVALNVTGLDALDLWVVSGPPPGVLREALDRLQRLEAGKPDFIHSLRGERALCLDAVRSFGKFEHPSGSDWVQVYGPIFGRSRTVRRLVWARVLRLYESVEDWWALTGRAKWMALPRVEAEIEKACHGWLGRGASMFSPFPMLSAGIQFARFELRWRALEVRIGLALYKAEHGCYPDTLDEIEPYLGHVPLDPFTEEPFRYRVEGDDYIFYSIGSDLVDNGGVDLRTDTARFYGARWWKHDDFVFTSRLAPPPSLEERLGPQGRRPVGGRPTGRLVPGK